jgi:hypothetical protein
VGSDGLAQGVDLVDFDVELAGLEQVEDAVGVELQLLARHDVLHQGRAHDGDIFRREARDVEWWDGTGCWIFVIVSVREGEYGEGNN